MFWIQCKSEELQWQHDRKWAWFYTPPLRCPCKEMIVRLRVVDVGRGNRGGMLVIYLVRKRRILVQQLLSLRLHQFGDVNIRLTNTPVLNQSSTGDVFLIRRYDGNPRQRVSDFQLGLLGHIHIPHNLTQTFDVKIPVMSSMSSDRVVQAYTHDFKLVRFSNRCFEYKPS